MRELQLAIKAAERTSAYAEQAMAHERESAQAWAAALRTGVPMVVLEQLKWEQRVQQLKQQKGRGGRRDSSEEVTCTAAAEDRVPATSTEAGAQVGSLAALKQDNANQDQADHKMKGVDESLHEAFLQFNEPGLAQLRQARAISAKASGSRLAPPTRAPLISGCESNSLAFDGFTEPPYKILV